jgi:hypothetical protein
MHKFDGLNFAPMKKVFSAILALSYFYTCFAQVADRYPLIQSPNENSVVIGWNNATAGIGTVKWGNSPTTLTNIISEQSANQIHGITISGLQPNTKYYYQASCGSFQSSVEYFYTAKPDSVRQMDFVVYGDCGFNSAQQDQISALMAAQPQDFGLVVGDVDQILGNNYDVNYFPHYTGMTKHTCHFTAIGNHDIMTNNTNYTDAFILPHNNPANTELYYSFTWGNAKFIALDGNIDYTAGSAQYTWLQNELKCNDREWTFVFFHQPPWSNAWDISYYIPLTPFFLYQGNTDMRTSIVPLFEQYHVNFVLNGHTHDYQRGALNGVNYFIAGGGGTSTPDVNTNSNSPNIQYEQDLNNYMKFSIDHDTARYYTYDLNGNKIDSGVFTKNFTPYQAALATINVACNGQQTGSAQIVVTGPKAPYSYLWSNGATTDSISNVAAGEYQLTITDVNGCVKADSASILQTNPVVVQSTVSNASCPGFADGIIVANCTGGTPPYQYNWSTTDSLNHLSSGNYTLTVLDVNNCSVLKDFAIQNTGGHITPVLSVQNSDSIVCKYDSVRIDATQDFSVYNWNSGATSPFVYAHSGGAYYLQATDSFGCVVNSDTMKLISDSVPHLQLSYTTYNLAVILNADETGLGFYHWNFGNGYSATDTGSGIVYIYPAPGTYTITLVTQHYCGADTVSTTVQVPVSSTGVNDLTADVSISLAPNPFHNQTVASIIHNPDISYHAVIYSLDGKMVQDLGEHSDNMLTISGTELAAGEYILMVYCGHVKAPLKLVVE